MASETSPLTSPLSSPVPRSSSKSGKKHLKEKNAPHFEFGGPIGVLGMMTALPAVVYFLYFACRPSDCLTVIPLHFPAFGFEGPWITWQAFGIVVTWFAWQALLYMLLPARIVQGVTLADGTRLNYRVNAFVAFMVSLAVILAAVFLKLIDPTYIYHHFVELATSAIVFSALLATFLYVKAAMDDQRNNLSEGGNTGNPIYDFFIGRQLNPRNGEFDWKYFCELRPGLIGWVMINLSMMATQYAHTQSVSASMIMVNVFQFVYVFDALAAEPAILTTLDIVHDGFGFMLAFGDLAWVPFTYSLQTRFLVDHSPVLEYWHIGAILTFNLTGYCIFRLSNLQKNAYRTNPNDPRVKHLKVLKTEAGTNLLVSGWWGMARHINYLGDWLMAIAWSLPTGFSHAITYFYPIYFGSLLVHREIRDEEKCRRKYGKDYDRYCQIVKSRIIPYIY